MWPQARAQLARGGLGKRTTGGGWGGRRCGALQALHCTSYVPISLLVSLLLYESPTAYVVRTVRTGKHRVKPDSADRGCNQPRDGTESIRDRSGGERDARCTLTPQPASIPARNPTQQLLASTDVGVGGWAAATDARER